MYPAKQSPDKPPPFRPVYRSLALNNLFDYGPQRHRFAIRLANNVGELSVKMIHRDNRLDRCRFWLWSFWR
jgi:hypothetical protein